MTKFIGKTLHMEPNLIAMTRKLYLSLQTKGKYIAARKQAVPEDEIFYAYDKSKNNVSSFKSQTSINTKDMFLCNRHKIDNTSKMAPETAMEIRITSSLCSKQPGK